VILYKNKEKQREANKVASAKRRAKGMTQGMTKSEGMTAEEAQKMLGIKRGQRLYNFTSRGNNLEKMQRICGSLGKYANEVWMGDLSVGEIGEVIGVKEGLYCK